MSFPSSEHVKQSPKQKIKAPRAAAPAAACVAGRSLACERIPLRHRSNLQRKKQHRHSGIFRVADLGPGTMPRGKYPESPAPAGSHALISRTPTPGGMLHANLGLPRPPPRNFQPPLPQQPPKQTQQRRHNVPPVQSLRDSAAATPVGCAAWRRRFPIFSFRYREMMSGMINIFDSDVFLRRGFFHTLSRGQHMLPHPPSKQTATAPHYLNPSYCRSRALRSMRTLRIQRLLPQHAPGQKRHANGRRTSGSGRT